MISVAHHIKCPSTSRTHPHTCVQGHPCVIDELDIASVMCIGSLCCLDTMLESLGGYFKRNRKKKQKKHTFSCEDFIWWACVSL